MAKEVVTRLIKQPNESRMYGVDFSNFDEIEKGGEEISEVLSVVAVPDGLTIAEEQPLDEDEDGRDEVAAFRVSGGAATQQYKVTVLVETDSGNILEGEGVLELVDL